MQKKIVLENGLEFHGTGFGADVEKVSELVFDTSAVGYQEVLTDLSYAGQMVVMAYPIIGSYGINDDDSETRQPAMGGLIVREYNDNPSNFRFTKTLAEEMEECGIPGIAGIDTRTLVHIIRTEGEQKVCITNANTPKETALELMKEWAPQKNIVAQVSCKKRWYARTPNHQYTVAVLDCGLKLSIVEQLKYLGCNVTVLPYNTTAEEILELDADGLFVTGGPGSPADATEVIETVRRLIGKMPILGTNLGHQVIALAFGAKTYKMKCGHRGTNHPIKNLLTNKVEVATQNHSHTIDKESLKNTGLTVTHINLLDDTVEGLENKEGTVLSVQYYPEITKTPTESHPFARFVKAMNIAKGETNNA